MILNENLKGFFSYIIVSQDVLPMHVSIRLCTCYVDATSVSKSIATKDVTDVETRVHHGCCMRSGNNLFVFI